jgi:hypothetical protein
LDVEAMDLEVNAEETEVIVEQHEVPNKEDTIHSMRAW